MLGLMAREDLTLAEAVKRLGAPQGRLSGDALRELALRIVSSQPDVAETIRNGLDKKGGKIKFLQGLVMKEARGQADPNEVAGCLSELLGS